MQTTATATHPAMKHLVFAQDVGSAIQGDKRLDVYWGEGEKAEYQASTMKSPIDHLWILLPKSWDKHTILQIIKDGQEN
jgi:membrane-bound lytic murein transglycosylase